MIQLIPQLRILLACQPVDFRNGIDGLAAPRIRSIPNDPHQIRPGIDPIQPTRLDQRSQQVTHGGSVRGFEEQRVLPHQDELLERPLAFVVVERSPGNP
jgi:hypothetical protein